MSLTLLTFLKSSGNSLTFFYNNLIVKTYVSFYYELKIIGEAQILSQRKNSSYREGQLTSFMGPRKGIILVKPI